MCKRNVLTIVAVVMLALAIGQVQAVTVTVPNSGFELIYKPGTDILGVVSDGGWTLGVGPACPIDSGQYIFDDGTTGDVADIPGWLGYDRQGWIDAGGTYGRDETTGNFQGAVTTQGAPQHDGIHCFNVNGGGYGNAAGGLIVSDASLGNVKAGIYVLSMYVKNAQGDPALPRVLDLLADGVVVTPTSSVDPAPSADWQEYTRTYDFTKLTSYVGQAITIVLGVGREATGAQSHFDSVSLSYEHVLQASEPIPADEATEVLRDVALNWTPGEFAPAVNGHTVYLSESFDDVNDGIGGITHSASSYDAGRLKFGTLYYWRVDEVNAPPDSTVFPGEVWSFTVESLAYPIPSESITATASSQASDDEGPEKTIDSSGLDPNDLHSADPKAMWISEASDPGSAWIQYVFDKLYNLHEMLVWNYNGNSILSLYGLKEVTIEYSTDGTNWSQLENIPEFVQAIGDEGYAANTTVAFNGTAAKYVKITANSNWGGGEGFFNQYGLSEIQFLAIPMAAREMNPADGTILPGVTAELGWRVGRQAEFHDVYISTDMQAVIDGIAPVERVNTAQYTAEFDLLGATYYWKVNEVNEAEVPAVWEGPVQSLTTSAFLVIENFDDYNISDNQIWWSWKDGLGYVEHDGQPTYTGNGTGSAVGDETTATFMEMNIVQGGTQSMPVWYDNNKQDYAKYSETALTLPAGKRDWTKGSPVELSLWFRGEAANTAERLYVAVSDTAVVYHEDLNAAQLTSWTEWVIPLETLAGQGVSLANVDSIAIGLGTRGNVTIPGGAGKMYFDEIQLHQDRSAIVSITVPNGDFEEIYKPGSDTITADLGGGWTQGLGPDAPMDDGTATYSDGTTGDAVDIPGWIGADPQGWIDNGGTYGRDTNFPNRQGSVQANGVEGSYAFLSNGGDWGNPAGGLIVSDASLGNVENGTYTLSMLANGPDGPATPVVLELLADGVALTPSSSVDPVLSGEWQEFSRTYDAASLVGHLGESLTIRLGVGRGASGGQSHFDAVSLSYVP